jgi:hypothetical protein
MRSVRARSFVPLLLATTQVGACSQRPADEATRDDVALTGRVLHVDDASEVDGPIVLTIESPPDHSVELYWGSMFTSPSPDASRRATFALVRRARVGDRVRVHGTWTDAGQLWLDRLENLGRD